MRPHADLLLAQSQLLADWNRGDGADAGPPNPGMAVAQATVMPDPPRPGLAVGIGRAADGTASWLEVRVDDSDADTRERAERLIGAMRDSGVTVRTRSVPIPEVRADIVGQDAQGARFAPARIGQRCSPPWLGCSISHYNGAAGTIGFYMRTADGRLAVLSCSHVLARGGDAQRGDVVHHPGYPDENPLTGDSVFGRLEQFGAFREGGENIDLAVAVVTEDALGAANAFPGFGGVPGAFQGQPIGSVLPVAELAVGDRVAKLGRSTGFQTGTVSAVSLENVGVRFSGPRKGPYVFRGMIEIDWADSFYGDSGALVVRLDDIRPLGLHCAAVESGGAWVGYATPLSHIPARWGLTPI